MLVCTSKSRAAVRQRVKLAWPLTSSIGTRRGHRRGISTTEILLVLAVVTCLLLVLQGAAIPQSSLLPPATSATRGAGEDLSPVGTMAINSAQSEVVTVGMDGQLRIYDLKNRTCISEAQTQHGESRSICYSADDRQLLVGSGNGHIELWKFSEGGATSTSFLAHDTEVSTARFSPDGTCFLTCGGDRSCIVWDTATLKPIFEMERGPAIVRQACFTADGARIITGDVRGNVIVWNLANHKLVQRFQAGKPHDEFKSNVVGMSVLPGEQLLVALRTGGLSIIDLESGHQRRLLPTSTRELISVGLSPSGKIIVSGSLDGHVEVWDIQSGECLRTIEKAHSGAVNCVGISDNEKLIVSAGWDGQLKFWEM